jgi:hypothetical protein
MSGTVALPERLIADQAAIEIETPDQSREMQR